MTDTAPWVTVSAPHPDRISFRMLRMRVIAGPDVGKVVEFDDETVRIGALADNHLVLTDPRVSGLHVEIRVEPGGVRVIDPGSTNGVWIGELRVGDVFLGRDAEVRLGDTVLRLEDGGTSREITLPTVDSYGPLVGGSASMRQMYARLAKIAQHDVPVLITGETGAGKEMVARAIHEASARGNEPFSVVECAAIPANLIESELFGYERGAFTGADKAFPGAFERAGAGTILLDELGELPLSLQPKLLRALDSLEVRRLGSDKPVTVKARVMAATNRNVAAMVGQQTFRADLYYRLAVAEVHVPPLRERAGDIALLADHFLQQHPGASSIERNTLDVLRRHPWPGNVRELRNAVQRIALLGDAPVSVNQPNPADDIGPAIRVRLDLPYKQARDTMIDELRKLYAETVLEKAGGSVSAAARLAGVDRMTLYRMLRRRAEDEE